MNEITPAIILSAVATEFNVKEELLKSKSKDRGLTLARCAFTKILTEVGFQPEVLIHYINRSRPNSYHLLAKYNEVEKEIEPKMTAIREKLGIKTPQNLISREDIVHGFLFGVYKGIQSNLKHPFITDYSIGERNRMCLACYEAADWGL